MSRNYKFHSPRGLTGRATRKDSCGSGVIKEMAWKGIQIDKVIHFSPADPSDFFVTLPNITYQIDVSGDMVLLLKNSNDEKIIQNINYFGLIKNPQSGQAYFTAHSDTRENLYVWKSFLYLESVKFENMREESFNGSYKTVFKAINFSNAASFFKIKKDGILYFSDGIENQYFTLKKKLKNESKN